MGGTFVTAVASAAAVDYADIQGIVRFAYKSLTEACYLLATIKDERSARQWLQNATVATAVEAPSPPPSAVQVAFTALGLQALHVPADVISGFSPEFIAGIAENEARSRRLGDIDTNAPEHWEWGLGDRTPHVLVALFARPGGLDALKNAVRAQPWVNAFEEIACLDTSDLHGVEQFGFTDGISQPAIDWDRCRPLRGDKVRYGNVVALGEFLLGYPNEYNSYTERPLLPEGGVNDILPFAEDDPKKRDAGRNGTYLVLRDLRQDVRSFWQFVYARASSAQMSNEDLAAKFVGRKKNGDPLVALAQTAIEGTADTPQATLQNRFTYTEDPGGVHCPYGAHIRRANPRNADYPSVPSGPIGTLRQMLGFSKSGFLGDLISSTRFHRILRRGREYGPGLSPADAQTPAPPDDAARGLRFVCLNANIARQFEFLQSAWIMKDTFGGLRGESDPLLGNRRPTTGGAPTDGFGISRRDAAPMRVGGLPQFVTVTGGAYFFLPGLRALRYLAQAGAEDAK